MLGCHGASSRLEDRLRGKIGHVSFAATGPVPIDEHHLVADKTEVITPDTTVHQFLTSQPRTCFCCDKGMNDVG